MVQSLTGQNKGPDGPAALMKILLGNSRTSARASLPCNRRRLSVPPCGTTSHPLGTFLRPRRTSDLSLLASSAGDSLSSLLHGDVKGYPQDMEYQHHQPSDHTAYGANEHSNDVDGDRRRNEQIRQKEKRTTPKRPLIINPSNDSPLRRKIKTASTTNMTRMIVSTKGHLPETTLP
jgi:hypothetical protein